MYIHTHVYVDIAYTCMCLINNYHIYALILINNTILSLNNNTTYFFPTWPICSWERFVKVLVEFSIITTAFSIKALCIYANVLLMAYIL